MGLFEYEYDYEYEYLKFYIVKLTQMPKIEPNKWSIPHT